jgi:uncharacterized secreted protein with C-terminal beta-propeller domain
LQKNLRALLPLFVITGAFLVIGVVLIGSGVLPEERAREFHSLTDVSIPSDMKVIKEPTLEDNTFITRLMMSHNAASILLEVMQE